MKRYISLVCVAMIVVLCFPLSAYAADFDNYDSINVLDYYKPGLVDLAVGLNTITLEFPDYLKYQYIDFVIQCTSTISGVYQSYYGGNYPLNIVDIGNNYYRIYGGTAFEGTSIKIVFDIAYVPASSTWVNFVSFYVYTDAFLRFDSDAYCEIVSAEYNSTIHYIPTDDINYRIFTSTDSYEETFFIAYVWNENWKKYDYIDFQLMFDCFDITSITAVMGSTNISLDVSYIDGTNIDFNNYFVSMRMDLNGLDRESTDYPMITIMGRLNTGATNSVDFVNCSGYVRQSNTIELYYYFLNLKNYLSAWFSSLNSWLDNQTSAIVNAIRGDTVAGDNFQAEVDEKKQELDDMAAVMDSVDRPELDSVNVSADTYIDQTVLATSMSGLTTVISMPVFLDVIIMSLMMATCGYVLFGKR